MKDFNFKLGKYTFNNKVCGLNERPLVSIFVDTEMDDGRVIPVRCLIISYHNLVRLIKNPLGYCGCCQRYFVYPKRFHRNTAYVNAESNYGYLCKDCQEEENAYYQDLWDDYWASRF
jgi:hypothetical protein